MSLIFRPWPERRWPERHWPERHTADLYLENHFQERFFKKEENKYALFNWQIFFILLSTSQLQPTVLFEKKVSIQKQTSQGSYFSYSRSLENKAMPPSSRCCIPQ
jgi:hypothetical protein